jgi:hypothetical protein
VHLEAIYRELGRTAEVVAPALVFAGNASSGTTATTYSVTRFATPAPIRRAADVSRVNM